MSDVIFKPPPITIHERLQAQELGEKLPWHLTDYKIPEAWKKTSGKGVTVGIVDSGIDEQHRQHGDLQNAVEDAQSFAGGTTDDVLGHGTHVAGIIGARHNHQGVAGLAPDCRLAIARALGDNGSGSETSVSAGIEWCVEQGCHVINLSLGSSMRSERIAQAIESANNSGAIVVAAAGNDGGAVNYPARLKDTLAVSAIDRNRQPAPFTSRGAQVDVGAPGVKILSTYKFGGYAVLSGTSMAAPWISGLLALKIANDLAVGNGSSMQHSAAGALEFIAAIAKDAGDPGRDDLFGEGIPDLTDAFRQHAEIKPVYSFAGIGVWIPARSDKQLFSVGLLDAQ